MSTPASAPPADTPKDTPPTPATTTTDGGKWFAAGGIAMTVIGILMALYVFAFHLGAAVLSYQKFGSFLWAILDFFFPYFYYPYYAFVASKQEVAPTVVMGGARRIFRRRTAHGTFRRI